MKRFLTILLTIMIILSFAVPATAKPKLPKNLCLSFDKEPDDTRYIALAFKKQASIKFADGKELFFLVIGVQNFDEVGPITGSGYIQEAGPQLLITGNSDSVIFYSFEVYWDIGSTGADLWVEDFFGFEESYNATVIDCKTLPSP